MLATTQSYFLANTSHIYSFAGWSTKLADAQCLHLWAFWASARNSEGPTTQYLRILAPNTIPLMEFGTRILK